MVNLFVLKLFAWFTQLCFFFNFLCNDGSSRLLTSFDEPKLHYFDLSWTCWTTSRTRSCRPTG